MSFIVVGKIFFFCPLKAYLINKCSGGNLMIAVVGYIFVFGTGLLGGFLFQFFIQDTSFPSK